MLSTMFLTCQMQISVYALNILLNLNSIFKF